MKKKLKVAIVHEFLTTMGGAERVAQALAEIFPEAPIYTLLYSPKVDEYFKGKQIIVSKLQRWYQYFKIPQKFLFPFMAQAIESFDFSGYDLVISSNHSFAGGIITGPETYHISYCHSPTRYLWDATHSYINEQKLGRFSKGIVLNMLHNLRMWDRLSSGRVQKFVANSHTVSQRIKKYYRRASHVIYPPVDTHLIKPKHGHQDYFLVLSRLSAYKRIDLVIEACNQLQLPLVIIGEGEQKDYLQHIAGDNVEILGWQSDQSRIEYLRNARALIFPGEEDFGIVPVEAMAAGKPVIAYRKGGVTETVVENRTGIFFDEQSTSSLTSALRRFSGMEKKFNAETIANHAAQFSRDHFKQNIRKLVEMKVEA